MFQMARRGPEFTGSRGCANGNSMATMNVPAAFGRWNMAEMAAALTILLSSGS
jgi:hypothetical protein